MKLIIDILELYENISEIPNNNGWDEKAIIEKAKDFISDRYFPNYDMDFFIEKGYVKYLTFSNEYPSRIPDKITFTVIPL